jgi:aminoglycoside/choline kinase family phosphotransferase
MPERLEQIEKWLRQIMGASSFDLTPASNDASFRRYWRVAFNGTTRILMDAPPEKEDCRPFIEVSSRLFNAGLNVPDVLERNLERGFLLLTDLGNDLYLSSLNDASVERLYGDAIRRLVMMQADVRAEGLPPYDRRLLMQEMELFRVWLLGLELGLELDREQQAVLDEAFHFLADAALAQPQVFVHRDYHSRNLLVREENNPGILDFQDAVLGPVTYDLVSLLKDCYVRWPTERVRRWALDYYEEARDSGVLPEVGEALFLRWFDLMGAQRHLKASGIFARLWHRDGKRGYLKDVPRTVGYIVEVSGRYPELAGLHRLLVERVVPAMENKIPT